MWKSCYSIWSFLEGPPRAVNPADYAACQVSPARRAGSAPRLAQPPRSSALAPLQWLHSRPHGVPRPPGDCTEKSDCASERGWRVGSCFITSPNPPGKTSRAKTSLPRDNSNSQAGEQRLQLPLATDSFKLRSRGCKLASGSRSPLALSSSRAHPLPPPGGGSGLLAVPASPAPFWLTRRTQPHMARLPVPGRAGLPGTPGAISLESLRAPPGRALLTCVFFIRKGSAAIQPRQRCGDSV